MKLVISLLFICLLSACDSSEKNGNKNQFSIKKNQLYYTGRLISDWPKGFKLPACIECRKNLSSKKSNNGPMFFKQITDERGDLVLYYTNNVAHNFAFNTGIEQHTAILTVNDGKISLKINNQQVNLKLTRVSEFTINQQSYYVALQKLKINDTREGQSYNYQATLLFWLKAETKEN